MLPNKDERKVLPCKLKNDPSFVKQRLPDISMSRKKQRHPRFFPQKGFIFYGFCLGYYAFWPFGLDLRK
jgi:hypothetical protein